MIAVLLMGGVIGYVYVIPHFRRASSPTETAREPPTTREEMITASKTWLVGAVAWARQKLDAARGLGASQSQEGAYHSAEDNREPMRDQELLAVARA